MHVVKHEEEKENTKVKHDPKPKLKNCIVRHITKMQSKKKQITSIHSVSRISISLLFLTASSGKHQVYVWNKSFNFFQASLL